MRENVFDVDHMPMKGYLGNQSILVSSDVEHDASADEISMRIYGANLRQISPFSLLRNSIPIVQLLSPTPFALHEFSDRPMTYYPHRFMFTLRERIVTYKVPNVVQ